MLWQVCPNRNKKHLDELCNPERRKVKKTHRCHGNIFGAEFVGSLLDLVLFGRAVVTLVCDGDLCSSFIIVHTLHVTWAPQHPRPVSQILLQNNCTWALVFDLHPATKTLTRAIPPSIKTLTRSLALPPPVTGTTAAIAARIINAAVCLGASRAASLPTAQLILVSVLPVLLESRELSLVRVL